MITIKQAAVAMSETRLFKAGRAVVIVGSKDFTITRIVGGKPLRMNFKYSTNPLKIRMDPISYHYNSKVSLLDYRKNETRFCRNHSIIAWMSKILEQAGIWHSISNKGDIIINKHLTEPEKIKQAHLVFTKYKEPKVK